MSINIINKMLSNYDYPLSKVILLGYKVLELKLFSFGKLSFEILKKGDLKLFNNFFF